MKYTVSFIYQQNPCTVSVVIRIKKNIFSDWFCDYQLLAYFDNLETINFIFFHLNVHGLVLYGFSLNDFKLF